MAFDINTFVSTNIAEHAKSSTFLCKLTDFKGDLSATFAEGGSSDAATLWTYTCKGIQIPSSTIGVINVNYQGRPIKYPGNRTFEDLTTTVMADEGHATRNNIESWLHKLNHNVRNVRDSTFVSKPDYTANMSLEVYDKEGSVQATYTFKNVFPTSLDAVDVAWDSNDAIMEYTVTWSYDWWEHSNVVTT